MRAVVFGILFCGPFIIGGLWLLVSAFRTRRSLAPEQREAIVQASLVSGAVASDNLPAALLIGLTARKKSDQAEIWILIPILAFSALLQVSLWFGTSSASDFVEGAVSLFSEINSHIPAIASIDASEKLSAVAKAYDAFVLDVGGAYTLIVGLVGIRAIRPLRPIDPTKGMLGSLLFAVASSYFLYFDHDAAHSRFISVPSLSAINLGVLSTGVSTFVYAFFSYLRQFVRERIGKEV